MKRFDNAQTIHQHIQGLHAQRVTIGFVPTMGALHKGHLSLVERSKKENDVTVVSIFVNRAQFNNPDDLKNYPRDLEKDVSMLESAGVDVLFSPDDEKMYGGMDIEKEKAKFNFGELEQVMEGKFRPGHFKGVALAVSRLFEIIPVDKAYFGEKDYQQLLIIKELVKQKNYKIQIIGCPTVREQNGLAMSSRNALLTEEQRKQAGIISKALFAIRDNSASVEKAKQMIEAEGMKVEYLETYKGRVFAAVQSGNVRLIDNVSLLQL